MAATGFTPISLYYSTTASAVPTAGNLANGELALNIADMKLYAKNSSGVVTLLASNASTTGVDSLSFGSTGLTPSTATTGAITVAGTLATTNGGTGLTSFTSGGVVYASSTSALTTGSALTFDGTNLATTGGVLLNNARYFYGKTSGGTSVRLLGINAGDTVYVGAIDAGPTSTIFNASSTSTSAIFYASGSEQMRLTSTGLGIGTSSPAYKLHVSGSSPTAMVQDTGANASQAFIQATNSGNYFGCSTSGGTTQPMIFYVGTERMRLDSAGNLGLGVTPSAWSAGKAFEVGAVGTALWSNSSVDAYYTQGAYFNAGWKYSHTGATGVSNYQQSQGAHTWSTAAGGTAGNAVSFTQAMKLTAAGDLGLGTTSPATYSSRANLYVAGSLGGALILGEPAKTFQAVVLGDYNNGVMDVGTITNHPMRFLTNNTERFRIGTSGQLGIGSTPSYGTSGQVLTSAGSGAAPTWSTPTGISTGKSIAMAMIFGF